MASTPAMATLFFSPGREPVGGPPLEPRETHVPEGVPDHLPDPFIGVSQVDRAEGHVLVHRGGDDLTIRVLEHEPDPPAELPEGGGIVPEGIVVIEKVPESGRSMPLNMRRSVDFPAPFGPTRATFSPRRIWKLMPRMASTPPGYRYRTSRASRMMRLMPAPREHCRLPLPAAGPMSPAGKAPQWRGAGRVPAHSPPAWRTGPRSTVHPWHGSGPPALQLAMKDAPQRFPKEGHRLPGEE